MQLSIDVLYAYIIFPVSTKCFHEKTYKKNIRKLELSYTYSTLPPSTYYYIISA